MVRYYVDTCVWRDHYECRFGHGKRPLGECATQLFMKIMQRRDVVLVSELVVKELRIAFEMRHIDQMFAILSVMCLLEFVEITSDDKAEASAIAVQHKVAFADALHAVVARNNKAILVTQNKRDFEKLKDIVPYVTPDQLI